MKILFPAVDRSIRVATHFTQFQKALSKVADVDFLFVDVPRGWKTGTYATRIMNGSIRPERVIDKQLKLKKYDFLVTDSDFVFVHEDWKNMDIPTAIIIEDSQKGRNPNLIMKWALQNRYDIIFYKYKVYLKNYGNYSEIFKYIWLPHSIDIEMFKDYGLEKKYPVLMVGQRNPKVYPNRYKAYESLKNKPWFTAIGRPIESNVGDEYENKVKWPIRKDYAKLLNQSDICITCGSTFKFPVMKYFEIPASKSLLVSNWFEELGDLGFEDGQNMVVADYSKLDLQMTSLLNDKKKLKRIQNNGYDLIHKFHTCDIRADQMVRHLEQWLKK